MNTVFLEKICRCCLNESEDMTINLSDHAMGFGQFTFDDSFTYSHLIYLCTSVRCDCDTNDHIIELPRHLCENCLHELRAAFLFRQKCETSEQLLREQTLVGIHRNENKEETIEFEHSTHESNRIITNSYNVKLTKEIDLSNDDRIKDESDPIAIDETGVKNDRKKAIAVQTIPGNSIDIDEQTSHKIRENSTKNHDLTSALYYEVTHQREEKGFQQKTQEKKYKCMECSKEYRNEKNYLAHKNMHSDETTKQKFLCSTCGKFFATKQRLDVHAAKHSGEKNHQCKECGKKFGTKSRLRCHRRVHTGEKPFRCDQCDLTFAQGNALMCHKRIHTGEKPYECHVCKKRFTQNTILKTHMTLHTGKTVKCPDCGKLFSRTSNLILHRREHTGDRPYRCDKCPKQYKQKVHLDNHMDTHFGVKHTCQICQKAYSKRWSLKCHMLTHSNEKPHSCSLCDADFIRRDKLRSHLKLIHGLTDSAAIDLTTKK